MSSHFLLHAPVPTGEPASRILCIVFCVLPGRTFCVSFASTNSFKHFLAYLPRLRMFLSFFSSSLPPCPDFLQLFLIFLSPSVAFLSCLPSPFLPSAFILSFPSFPRFSFPFVVASSAYLLSRCSLQHYTNLLRKFHCSPLANQLGISRAFISRNSSLQASRNQLYLAAVAEYGSERAVVTVRALVCFFVQNLKVVYEPMKKGKND